MALKQTTSWLLTSTNKQAAGAGEWCTGGAPKCQQGDGMDKLKSPDPPVREKPSMSRVGKGTTGEWCCLLMRGTTTTPAHTSHQVADCDSMPVKNQCTLSRPKQPTALNTTQQQWMSSALRDNYRSELMGTQARRLGHWHTGKHAHAGPQHLHWTDAACVHGGACLPKMHCTNAQPRKAI
jgi:hypothetical protein